MEPLADHAQIERIGDELFDRFQAGTLDFDAFKTLFHRALSICGPGDEMEMFCHFARGEGWWDWMVQELQKAPSQRVA